MSNQKQGWAIAGITVSGTLLGIILGLILGVILGGMIGAAAGRDDTPPPPSSTAHTSWVPEIHGFFEFIGGLFGAMVGGVTGITAGAVIGTLLGVRWAQKITNQPARPVEQRANLTSTALPPSEISGQDHARSGEIADRGHQDATQSLKEQTRANPALCPACGEPLIPQDVRCPGCDIALR